VSDIDTAVADSLKVLDLKRPIREADVRRANQHAGFGPTPEVGCATSRKSAAEISIREGRFSVVTLPAAIRQSPAPPMPWRMLSAWGQKPKLLRL
jgi:hypothetical protein